MATTCRIFDMGYKEVINLADGARLGYVNDAEIDIATGQIVAFVIPGKSKFFGIFGREPDVTIEWDCIEKIGEDIVLIRKENYYVKKLPEKRFF